MKKRRLIKVVCAMILSGCVVNGHAQTLQGKITDTHSLPVPNVTVHLLNTAVTTVTNKEGDFSVQHLPAGRYTVELSSVGYATTATEVEVKDKAENVVRFQLQNALLQLETVTVTAEKKEELLQKIPVSISAISARRIEELRLWNSKDLTAIVPNLASGNSGDGRNVTSIRGITTTSYDPAVTTYIDGVNQFSLDTYIPQLADVERIEVLRGPQGALYGRNAMGGVINIITKQPSNTTSGFAEINIGNYNQQRYSAGIRTPLIKDKLFFGASGVFSSRNGYYTNQFNNSSFDKQQSASGNYYLKYLPGSGWAVTLNVKHQNNKNDGAFPLVNGVEDAFKNPYQLNQNAVGKMIDNTLNASLAVNHSGGAVNFSSQLAWQNNHRYYKSPLDGDFSPLDAVTVINDYGNKWNNVKVITHEMKFSSATNKSSKFSWTAGTYFFHQNNPNKQSTHFGKDGSLLGAPNDFASINTSTAKNTGFAIFGQANYNLTRKLMLVAGLRYDYEHKYLEVQGEGQPDGSDAFVTRPDTSAARNFNAISPKVGLQYQVANNSNLFANYSRGFRTGGLTQLSSDPSQPPLYPFQPEYSNNIELGIKNELLDQRLRLNFTLFLSHINNAQVPTLVLPDAITVTKNTGELTSKGAELELLFAPVKGLQLGYNLGYTNAKYKSLKVASNGDVVNLDGKHQIFTPDVTSVFTLQYGYLINAEHQVKLVAGGEWYYLGAEYFDLANNIRQGSNQRLNVRAGVSSKHLEVYFWARNITKTKYIEHAYDFGAVHLGDPGTYGVTLKTTF
ncbi:MAG: TonB-dependent receptor [Ferruginibacter sp.]|uniref:TonB-dependent receptor n=1 Tax=Ferruginibacter sp. TaxID=1940288 RepID=UPI002659CFDF|nr:TonB-dependent receptor [Ferruginibacter sp.]MDB5278175.1 TonB-dependent receptor [Ferruginibacter sp.]